MDSASSDGTMDLIRRYPITAVRLEANPLLCPSAGRYMGNLHSHGKFVYFLDGDMIPIKGWIRTGTGAFSGPAHTRRSHWQNLFCPSRRRTQ